MRLIKGLSEERLLDRIRKFNRIEGVSQRALGFYLLDFDRRGLYKRKGFAGTGQFALMKLHIDPKRTRELLRIARALEELTLIDEAFSEERISWSAVREVTRVAVKETEDEWLALAEKGTLRKIEHAVSRARRGERPPKDPYSLSRTRLKVTAELPIEDYAVWKAAFDRLAEICGGEMDVSTALLLLSTSYLERPLDKEEQEARKVFQVVYHRCGECARTWLETEDGPAGVPAKKVGWREQFAEVVELEEEPVKGELVARAEGPVQDAPRGARVSQGNNGDQHKSINSVAAQNAPRGASVSEENNSSLTKSIDRSAAENAPRGASVSPLNGTARLSSYPASTVQSAQQGSCALKMQPIPLDDRDKPNTPLIRHQVLSRDGQRCATPGCANQGELFSHHVKWRSLGGRTVLVNEVCVCQRCHSLIHEGLLRVEGLAPHGLRWHTANGEPLQALEGVPHLEGAQRARLRYKALAGDGEEQEDNTIYSLDEVPDEITLEWWAKYKHNVYFEGKHMMLKKR